MHKHITTIEAARDEAVDELLGSLGLCAEGLRIQFDEPLRALDDLFPHGVPSIDDLVIPGVGAAAPSSASAPKLPVPSTAKTTSTRAKRRITIWLDHEVVDEFKRRAGKRGYQTLMARTLRDDVRRTRKSH